MTRAADLAGGGKKALALPPVVLSWVVYLALPFSLHPSFMVLQFATQLALIVAVTVSTFKKYR